MIGEIACQDLCFSKTFPLVLDKSSQGTANYSTLMACICQNTALSLLLFRRIDNFLVEVKPKRAITSFMFQLVFRNFIGLVSFIIIIREKVT
ncbi:wsv352 [White spot syndrome virus]|uniref:Wsv352 n=4 Tax=White spot syndrome virus TaxID=342409 RepID=Q8VAP9_WSSVS|nr:wsv352 [Shrimp white spot syndrome virus]AFX59729.1 wsv352 [White spot syndrome virus]AAL33354.1 wsv352 [Shrimp white spot syndrome virus]AAL89276.1 WSSV408 [Shrimp white spot syndrome virus]AWQ60479.1 wsv352 [Shrimp white spot syndrome virus]AWQ60924.1 wsv352 [Shrimp white spot syndrome virus]